MGINLAIESFRLSYWWRSKEARRLVWLHIWTWTATLQFEMKHLIFYKHNKTFKQQKLSNWFVASKHKMQTKNANKNTIQFSQMTFRENLLSLLLYSTNTHTHTNITLIFYFNTNCNNLSEFSFIPLEMKCFLWFAMQIHKHLSCTFPQGV